MQNYTNLTHEERLHLADSDPEMEKALDTLRIAPPDLSDPVAVVTQFRTYLQSIEEAPSNDVQERELEYTTRDGTKLALLVIEPLAQSTHLSHPPAESAASHTTKTTPPRPLVVFFHGGGCCAGRPQNTRIYLRHLALHRNAVCVAPQYRLGPEYPFPTAMHDAWDALQWIAAHAGSDLGADASEGFIIGGVSAGASLAVALAHQARDAALSPGLTGVYLGAPGGMVPTLLPEDLKEMHISRTQRACAESPVMGAPMKSVFDECFKPDVQNPWYSPLLWPGGHRGIPKVYMQICGRDILRDDGLLWERVLREAGVSTRMDVYPGTPHMFWEVLSQLPVSKAAMEDCWRGLAWLLQNE